MRKRRSRFIREETAAPWITLAVILGLWWTGAYFIGRDAEPVPPGLTAAGRDAATGVSDKTGRAQTEPPDLAPKARSAYHSPAQSDAARRASEDAAEVARASDRPVGVSADARSAAGLVVPVVGIDPSTLRSNFHETRGGGSRRHEAMDILAPRGTTVVAAVEGRIVKLFTSAAGGLTIYQFDPEERFCYYYAHLDGYAPDLNEGQTVQRGQIIGYVGTTGNAPPDTPHLHFAIYRLGPDKKWWDGEPIDPFDVLR